EEGVRVNDHVWTRNYEKALVVVNLPGSEGEYSVKVESPRVDSFSGKRGTEFTVPPGDGVILVKE
ncbi:MAG: hypothetical protein OEY51_04865, partial [Cyclobacteriaceae bacterium]|nr:hypothetical protein [Cyclobacteriaceae bacterium]